MSHVRIAPTHMGFRDSTDRLWATGIGDFNNRPARGVYTQHYESATIRISVRNAPPNLGPVGQIPTDLATDCSADGDVALGGIYVAITNTDISAILICREAIFSTIRRDL